MNMQAGEPKQKNKAWWEEYKLSGASLPELKTQHCPFPAGDLGHLSEPWFPPSTAHDVIIVPTLY